jgi:RimJ/RimL family protein N-acetyltransferase
MIDVGVVSIRPYEVADTVAVYNAVKESTADLQPFMPWARSDLTERDQRAWLEAQVAAFRAGTAYEFAIVGPDDRYLGACGINQIDSANKRANLAYWVRSSATRCGVATAAVRQLAEWTFANTDLIRLDILVSVENVASLRVAERVGAVREGLLRKRLLLHGRSHDAVLFSLVRPLTG